MKNVIYYYYGLFPTKIYKENKIYHFFLRENKFCLYEFNGDISIIKSLDEISEVLCRNGIAVHTFVRGKNDELYIEFNNTIYVLLKVNSYEYEKINMDDIMYLAIKNQKIYDELKIDFLNTWKVRVDKLEKQMTEYNKEYEFIKKTFNYYIGLAENAISYSSKTKLRLNEINYVLSHNRLGRRLETKEIYNPLTFVFDTQSKDLSEYLKIKFFSGEDAISEYEDYIKKYKMNEIEYVILFSRMMYPDYYFYLIEDILYGKKEEEKIKELINKITNYEKFLINIYQITKNKVDIPNILWLESQEKNNKEEK